MNARLRLSLLALAVFSLLGTNAAHAQRGTPPAPGTTYSSGTSQNGKAGRWETKHDRPTINSKDGTTFGDSRTTVNGASRNSDPVVAANRDGRLYDKRNGRFLSEDGAADAMDRADAYNRPRGVTLADWKLTGDKPAAAGLNAGPFEDGRADILGGGPDDPGRLSVDVLRAEGEGGAQVVALENGYGANAELKGQLTLVGINGEVGKKWGDDMNNVNVGAKGQAYVGANGELGGSGEITTDGVTARGKAGVFAGGKAEGEISGGFTICGVNIGAKGTGEVSYGIGAEAEGYFKVNWSTMTVKIGGKAAATFGGGAGAGGEVEVSLAELMKNPNAAANCAFEKLKAAGEFVIRKGGELVDAAVDLGEAGIEKLGEAADVVGGAISDGASWAGDRVSDAGGAIADGASWLGNKLCVWCDDPPPPPARPVAVAPARSPSGYNGPRNAMTVPTGRGGPDSGGSGSASPGVGITR